MKMYTTAETIQQLQARQKALTVKCRKTPNSGRIDWPGYCYLHHSADGMHLGAVIICEYAIITTNLHNVRFDYAKDEEPPRKLLLKIPAFKMPPNNPSVEIEINGSAETVTVGGEISYSYTIPPKPEPSMYEYLITQYIYPTPTADQNTAWISPQRLEQILKLYPDYSKIVIGRDYIQIYGRDEKNGLEDVDVLMKVKPAE